VIVFDIRVNQKRLCRAGLENHFLLTAILSSVAGHDQRADRPYEFMNLKVSAMPRSRDKHFGWPGSDIGVGDTITIKILSGKNADLPVREAAAKRFRPRRTVRRATRAK
jgi:hypothetical protein